MTTDDLRTRAEAASLKRAPRHHIFESSNANAHYRAGFMDGFKWHAAQQPTREQVAEVLWNRANRWEPGMLPFDDICSVEREYWMKDADAVLALFDGAGS